MKIERSIPEMIDSLDPNDPIQKAVKGYLQRGNEAPPTAFEWMQVLRATWKYLLRPMWLLFFKWPFLFMQMNAETHEEARIRNNNYAWRESNGLL